jgi:glycerol-3-phosphate dehydrogenase (NAD(P)+)
LSEVQKRNVTVLGAGTWGLALAGVVARNGHAVRAWDFFPKVIEDLKRTRTTPRLPDYRIDESIELVADLDEAARGAEVIVVVVPSTAVRQTCESLKKVGITGSDKTWVICSKGIEQDTLMLLDAVVADVMGHKTEERVGALSGPSHAEEVTRGLPTMVTACSTNPEVAEEILNVFFHPRFRVYTHDDIVGVELGGALKNVAAIAAGVSDGMGFGDNSRAALVTRGLAEIVRLGVEMGARRDTFMGLSGLGDLVVTTGSPHSRNHRFGEYLAQGMNCEQALEAVGMVVEGYATAKSAYALARKFHVEMPIAEAVYKVLYESLPARDVLEQLLSREPKSETE